MLRFIATLICAFLLVVACSKSNQDGSLEKNIGDQIAHSRK